MNGYACKTIKKTRNVSIALISCSNIHSPYQGKNLQNLKRHDPEIDEDDDREYSLCSLLSAKNGNNKQLACSEGTPIYLGVIMNLMYLLV